MHELLPDVDRAVYVDTDMLFTLDPLFLWNTFDKFKPNQLVALPSQGPDSHPSKICSCVMVLNLAAMRNPERPFMASNLVPGWTENSLSAQAINLAHANGSDFKPMHAPWGDQGIYWVIWRYMNDFFVPLSQRWDVSICRLNYYLSLGHWHEPGGEDVTEEEQIKAQSRLGDSPEEFKQLIPGILHLYVMHATFSIFLLATVLTCGSSSNCQPGDIAWEVEDNHTGHPFAVMVTTITRYKWVMFISRKRIFGANSSQGGFG